MGTLPALRQSPSGHVASPLAEPEWACHQHPAEPEWALYQHLCRARVGALPAPRQSPSGRITNISAEPEWALYQHLHRARVGMGVRAYFLPAAGETCASTAPHPKLCCAKVLGQSTCQRNRLMKEHISILGIFYRSSADAS